MEEPSKEQIERLKEKHADRQLHLVEINNEGEEESYFFVMVGANADEYKKFKDDVFDAREKGKTQAEKSEKVEFVAKQAVLRQTAWPERDELKEILFKRPGFIEKLADKIPDHAGSSAEVRSKKL